MENVIPVRALPEVPEVVRGLIETYLRSKTLGASRNIREINDLFCAIANQWPGQSSAELARAVLETGEYFAATRGANTPAIGNAIRLVLKDLDKLAGSSLEAVRAAISQRRDEFNAQSLRNAELMAEYGANVLEHAQVVLPFDYSSTVQVILKRAAEKGNHLRLIVPESRVIDGGRPIANEATAWGHSVDFVLDMAFAYHLRIVDAVLIGAETIFADGDTWNTIGSYPLAELCQIYHVPYYVATELIKIDPRSFAGIRRPLKWRDCAKVLGHPDRFANPEKVSVANPDMDNVPGRLITGYITPKGVLLPQQIPSECMAYLASIGVSPLEP